MITMTITGETPEEIFSVIKGCSALIAESVPTATPDPAPVPAKVPAAPVAPAPAPATPVTPAPSYITPPPPPPIPMTAPAPAYSAPPAAPVPTAAPSFTLDQVTRAGADLITARPDLMNALMAILPKYGVQTLAALKPEQLGPVATELRALGAKI